MPMLLETYTKSLISSMTSFELDKNRSIAVKTGTNDNTASLLTSLDIDLDLAVFDNLGDHEHMFPFNVNFNAQTNTNTKPKYSHSEIKPEMDKQNTTATQQSDKSSSSSSDSLKIPLPKDLIFQHSHSFNELSFDFDNHFHFTSTNNDLYHQPPLFGLGTFGGTMQPHGQSFSEDVARSLPQGQHFSYHHNPSLFTLSPLHAQQQHSLFHQQQPSQFGSSLDTTVLPVEKDKTTISPPLKLNRNLKRKTKSLDQLPNMPVVEVSPILPPRSPLQLVTKTQQQQTSGFSQILKEETDGNKNPSVIDNFESILSSFKTQPQSQQFQMLGASEALVNINTQQVKTEMSSSTLKQEAEQEIDNSFTPPLFKKQKSLPNDFTINSLYSSKNSSDDTENRSNKSDPAKVTSTQRRFSKSTTSSLSKHSFSKFSKPKRATAKTLSLFKTSSASSKEKQRRVKWSDEDIRTIWTSIARNGNEWRVVQHDLPKRSYHQVKDKGRRLLRTECWQTGKCKKASDVACEVAKEIAKQVLVKMDQTGFGLASDSKTNKNENAEEEEEIFQDIGETEHFGENVKFEDLLPFDLNDNEEEEEAQTATNKRN